MPKSVLTRKRSWIARFAVLAMVFSLMAVALPASAHSVAIDTSTPCPAGTPSAGFTDIGGFDATTQLAINCLFAFGITTGTSATTYSPNDTTTRWQMALFLVRQAADHGLTIPTAVPQGYTDILTLPQSTQDAINQITQLGISKGTSTTTFSPFDGVSRWQMALFIYRLGVAAGVTFTNDSAHNEFTDIGGTLAEAQTAINALADAHVALGTGGSLFSPNLLLVRWQMALFLTRLLAADGIAAPAGLRVTVTPTAAATLATGQARTYVATFKNADGTAYTGRVGIQLVEASSGAPVYNDTVEQVVIEAVTDGLTGVGTVEVNGVAGTDGMVTFTIRHAGAAEDTIPVAWEDLDLDNSYGTTGNVAPTEPFGLGGVADFASGPATEAAAGTHTAFTVTKTTKGSDVFEASNVAATCGNGVGAACSFFYDSGDIFQIGAVAATLQDFEDALSLSDVVTTTYDPDTADQSTFNLVTDNAAPLTVTDPALAGVTVDAASYAIKGTADPGATIKIRDDVNGDGNFDAGEGVVATGTADADGAWTVTTPLQQGVVNNFVAHQVVVGTVTDDPAAGVDVGPITEGASAGATFTSSTGGNGGTLGVLDPGDTIVIVFSEPISGLSNGDTITVQDSDGSVGTLTRGTNATMTLNATGETMTVTVTAVVSAPGGTTGGIQPTATITAVSGFTDDDGEAINVTANGAGRTFGGF